MSYCAYLDGAPIRQRGKSLPCERMNRELYDLRDENAKLRKLLSCALISAGTKGRRFLDAYLQEDEGTTLWQELKSLGIEVD